MNLSALGKKIFKSRFSIVTIGILVLGVFFAVFYSQQRQETRSRATGTSTMALNTNTIYAQGAQLYMNGQPYRFTGVNAYHLATDYSINFGCGPSTSDSDIDNFFAGLRPNSMVRFWAFQAQAYNKNTGQIDYRAIDRVVNTAARYNQRLVMVLGNHQNACDAFTKNEQWYSTGYRQPYGTTANPLPYWDWMRQTVQRYATSPAVGMWEPINEPETPGSSGCSATAAQTLRSFFDAVGGEIKTLDPNHLVSSGVLGTNQCGAVGTSYQTLHQSPGIDVASYHDYGEPSTSLPAILQTRLNQMTAIGKPLFIGEIGTLARDNTANCQTISQRRNLIQAKMDAQFAAGIAGYLAWDWSPTSPGSCDYEFTSSDPLMILLRNYPLSTPTDQPPTSTPTPTPTRTPSPTHVPTSTPTRIPTPTPTRVPTPTPTRVPTPTRIATPTPTSLPSLTPVPGPTSLAVNLLLHGLGRGGDSSNPQSGGNANPLRKTRQVKIELFNSQNQQSLTKEGSMTFDSSSGSFKGNIDLGSSFSTEVYNIKVKSDQYLKTLVPGIQSITQRQTNTLPQTILTSGDINNDNWIDIADYNILLDCYSDLTPAKNCSDPAKKLSADITDDGNVNQFDYNLFLRELTNRHGE